MNKTLSTVIVISMLGFAAFFFIKGKQTEETPKDVYKAQQPTPAPTGGITEAPKLDVVLMIGTHEVVQTDAGYSPKTLTIKKGSTVTFKNETKEASWTASAIHPTHGAYPTAGGCLGSTFDACKGIQPGSSWSFTFDAVGSWGYHDHLNPSHFGKIIVIE